MTIDQRVIRFSRLSERSALDDEGLDLIVVPGVGFDRDMNRIGHGKGYYDSFIRRCYDHAKMLGKETPTLGNLHVYFGNTSSCISA